MRVRNKGHDDPTSKAFEKALRAPGHPEELAGLEPALDAFRSAVSEPVSDPASGPVSDPASQHPDALGPHGRSPSGSRSAHRRGLPRWRKPVLAATVSASLLVVATTTVAETGALPGPVQQMAHTVLGGIGVPQHGQRHRDGSSTVSVGGPGAPTPPPTDRPTGMPPVGSSSAVSLPGPPPSPGATGTLMSDLALCKVILVDQKGLHSKTIDPAARDQLTAVAGGEDRIIAYCETLLIAAGVDYPPPPSSSAASEHHPSPAPPRSRSSSR
ncbi:hypothetical protein [Catenulispora yoronensis]|uniref:hypothetical protein n=1 Tax=Catenulispora yoronensis TaxID=450799 RepID=UPI0031CE651D